MNELNYFLSQDIDLKLRLKVMRCELPWSPAAHPPDPFTSLLLSRPIVGSDPRAPGASGHGDLVVECQLWCDGEKVGSPLQTPSGSSSSSDGDASLTTEFSCWLRFPAKLSSLPVRTQLGFTVYAPHSPLRRVAVGGAMLDLFGKNRILRRGSHRLPLWPGRVAGGETPPGTSPFPPRPGLALLEKLIKRYERGDMIRVDWLDRVTIRQIERDNQRAAAGDGAHLMVEFPRTESPIVHQPAAGAQARGGLSVPRTGPIDPIPVPRIRVDAPLMPAIDGSVGLNNARGDWQDPPSPATPATNTDDDPRLPTDEKGNNPSVTDPSVTGPNATADAHSKPANETNGSSAVGQNQHQHQGVIQSPAATTTTTTTSATGTGTGAIDANNAMVNPTTPGLSGGAITPHTPLVIIDPEPSHDTPVDRKRHTLSHSLRRGLVDRTLRPSAAERRVIDNSILAKPPTTPLLGDQRDLLWRYRYYLRRHRPRSLAKFLLSVEWGDRGESREALGMLPGWGGVGTAEALVLLSCLFPAQKVREHAVAVLDGAPDDELVSYLLQLVQAIRYEPALNNSSGGNSNSGGSTNNGQGSGSVSRAVDPSASPLVAFLVRRSVANPVLGNYVYWYLAVEAGDAAAWRPGDAAAGERVAKSGGGSGNKETGGGAGNAAGAPGDAGLTGGALDFRSAVNLTRARARNATETYAAVLGYFQEAYFGSSPELEDAIGRQRELMSFLAGVHREVRNATKGESKARRIDRLRSMLHSREDDPSAGPVPFPLRLPLDPSIIVKGFIPSFAKIFTSALKPLGLKFVTEPQVAVSVPAPTQHPVQRTAVTDQSLSVTMGLPVTASSSTAPHTSETKTETEAGTKTETGPSGAVVDGSGSPGGTTEPSAKGDGERDGVVGDRQQQQQQQQQMQASAAPTTYGVIFKSGDDLRQDQLIVQLIALMDRLLKKEHLDLCLTPYGVLATSQSEGLVEFVSDCAPISEVIAQHKHDLHGFFPKDEAGETPARITQTFIKSCAGYSVITYLLAVGDRHLDNLMLARDGRLFHIDFSFILGRDPKPLPPPMKLCREMVDAMGGDKSQGYSAFKTLCCESYNILRKSSNLIISLFVLMADAGIPDIHGEIDATVRRLIDRFRPDLNDEEAVQWMLEKINDSATSIAPQVMEKFHQVAQYLRN